MPQYDLNFRDYLRIFRKRKLIILGTFITVSIATMMSLSKKQAATYSASTSIKIEERRTMAGLLTDTLIYNPADVMESETKILKGYPIIKQVALTLEKLNKNSSEAEISSVVSDLQANIETERVGSTNIIRITAKAQNAEGAIELANTLAAEYIKQKLAEKAKEARHVRQFIEEQLASLEERLRGIEDTLRKFNEQPGNIILAEPLQKQLMELEFQRATLLQKYTAKHPQVIRLERQIQDMEAQMKGFSGLEIEYARLTREKQVSEKLYGMFKERLEEARITEAQKVSDISVVDPAIAASTPPVSSQTMKIIMGVALGLFLGIIFAFIVESLDTSISTVEDVESALKLTVLGVIPSFESHERKRAGLRANLLRLITPDSSAKEQEARIRLLSHFEPRSAIAEAYRNVHTNLQLNNSKKVILVTSAGPREGKTTAVSNLGIVMAQAGLNTVLVTGDLRRPALAKAFGLARKPGFKEMVMGTAALEESLHDITDILVGGMSFEEVSKTPGLDRVWIIPSGEIPPNPVEVLSSNEVNSILEQLRFQFDVVIIDAPPVMPVTDASILASKADCVIIVYEIGRTNREALMRTKVQLESVGAKIAGVILNNTGAQKEIVGLYPYYSSKYRYYSQEKNAGEEKRA